MRHQRRGRTLGRSSSHRRALLRNLAVALFLTERDPEEYEGLFQADGRTPLAPPRFRGRIVTTLPKAKEVRPLVEKCITLAKQAQPHIDRAAELATDADRHSDAWRAWRKSDQWRQWNQAIAPANAIRRRLFAMLRDRTAVRILVDEIAPRFQDRAGGYTRVLRLAKPRLGDAGTRAILELVGVHDRHRQRAERPRFEDQPAATGASAETPAAE
jgi:large subunit ribosomal protein L17